MLFWFGGVALELALRVTGGLGAVEGEGCVAAAWVEAEEDPLCHNSHHRCLLPWMEKSGKRQGCLLVELGSVEEWQGEGMVGVRAVGHTVSW